MIRYTLILLLLTSTIKGYSQTWMSGYEFRKKITLDKTKIEGTFVLSTNRIDYDMPEFPVLIEVQDNAFKYRNTSSCDGVLRDALGRNIAFATAAAPTVKLSFQIEAYDPVLGKYRCWVKIPLMSTAKTTTPATAIYFYYGGNSLHDSNSVLGLSTWNNEYLAVWHMNGENSDFGSPNAIAPTNSLIAHQLNGSSRQSGKIGDGILLNGQTQYLHTTVNNSASFTVSAWIKWNGGNGPQVIASTDSVGTGHTGWQLQVNAAGKIELLSYKSPSVFSVITSANEFPQGSWTHVYCYYQTSASSSGATIYLNGAAVVSAVGPTNKYATGGYLSVGRSKSGTQYFNGVIDELRIFNAAKPVEWMKNEFNNQKDPASFYAIGEEEYNPSWVTFTGAANTNNWATLANWANNTRPLAGSKVRIAAGKTARITGTDLVFSQLVIEEGAMLSSAVGLTCNCNIQLAAAAALTMDEGKAIVLGGGGFSITGLGTINTPILNVNANSADAEILLQAKVNVSKQLKLLRGRLNSNGQLTLLSSSLTNTAALLAIENLTEAGIVGDVNVQRYVSGSFPSPATARGWRLFTSPVYASNVSGIYSYGLTAIQNSVFVNGANDAINGFDASPLHGATIYTHDQNRTGTLAQKYLAIPNMSVKIPLGKGFYLFSRGSRLIPNAYQQQVQSTPFGNPEAFILNYKGLLFTGDLTVGCSNKNTGEEGDGFNLIGNPYASPVTWGGLGKVNLQDAVWLFDPLNNGYYATNDPATTIASGTGFFVRVKNGFSAGSISFMESSKSTGTYGISPQGNVNKWPKEIAAAPDNFSLSKSVKNPLYAKLNLTLSRGEFSQPFLLLIKEKAANESSARALKVGDGFVSIGSVLEDGTRLSIDECDAAIAQQTVRLFVKGYEKGNYQLRLSGVDGLPNLITVGLRDNYLGSTRTLTDTDSLISFYIDPDTPLSFGEGRFELLLSKRDVFDKEIRQAVYPNPFSGNVHYKADATLNNASVVLSDLLGRPVFRKDIGMLRVAEVLSLETKDLPGGVYVLSVYNRGKMVGRAVKLLKE